MLSNIVATWQRQLFKYKSVKLNELKSQFLRPAGHTFPVPWSPIWPWLLFRRAQMWSVSIIAQRPFGPRISNLPNIPVWGWEATEEMRKVV